MIKMFIGLLLLISTSSANILNNYDFSLVTNTNERFTITTSELAHIYSGKIKRWANNQRIKIFVRNFDDYDQKILVREILGLSIITFREKILANKDIIIVNSNTEMGRLLNNTPGSIGILNNGYIAMYVNGKLNILKVIEG
mgnify:CR=1 FL=1